MKSNIKFRSIGYLLCIYLGINFSVAQNFKPIYYWTFDEQKPLSDKIKGQNWSSETEGLRKNAPISGNYFRFDENTKISPVFHADLNRVCSIEFWLKPHKDHLGRGQALFYYNNRKLGIGFSYPQFKFTSRTKTSSGEIVKHSLGLDFSGTGKESLDYLLDGQWHHFVFQYEVSKGVKEIWIDGELLPNLRVTDAPKGILCGSQDCNQNDLWFSQINKYNINYMGDIDEIAIYSLILPPELIRQHVADGKRGKGYNFDLSKARNLPPIVSKNVNENRSIDQKEFAPNHPMVKEFPLSQLKSFPLPRYQPNNNLIRLVNWMNPQFMGGYSADFLPRAEAIKQAYLIQEELALNWNYHLVLHGTKSARKRKDGSLLPITQDMIKLANKYPEIPLSLIILWPQVVPNDLNIEEGLPRIYQKQHSYFIKNSQGQKLKKNGRLALSPITPNTFIKSDGKVQAHYIQTLLDELQRPIELINENGEVPFLPYKDEFLEMDPAVVKDKSRTKAKSWTEYQAVQKTRLRKAYSQEFLQLDRLKNTTFSWYGVDGGPKDRFDWNIARKIGTKINGQYYSTPDFYVRWPDNWRTVKGAWRGFSWIEDSRKVELAAGDKLYSPFVAAGWDNDPEKNVRPSQWLALLKSLGPTGAEFFYSGFFSLQAPFPDPRNYVWQAVIPSYAQAITSRYEYVLRNGDVYRDRANKPLIKIPTTDPRIFATARKGDVGKIYVVAVSIQPQSNIKGNVPDQVEAVIELDGLQLKLMARRQGSVYYLDLSEKDEPICYQLDSWHETGHPSFWSKDFQFEAEVFDYSQNQVMKTERKSPTSPGDFRSFSSFLRATGENACSKYHFSPRKSESSYTLKVRARKSKGSNGKLGIQLDNTQVGEIKGIRSGDWRWYELSLKLKNLSPEEHIVSLMQIDPLVEIDKFVLEAQ